MTTKPHSNDEVLTNYKKMWDAGEFEFNHHFQDDLGRKPINPMRIYNVFIAPLLTQKDKEVADARREERERCITEAWSYIVDATHAESWGREELRKRLTPPDQTSPDLSERDPDYR